MGVDFYHCASCKESVYEEYVAHCSGCGHRICTSCVVNDDINSRYAYHYGVIFDNTPEQKEEYGVKSKEESEYGYEVGGIIDDTGVAPKYCPFCNGKKVNNEDLLKYLLNKLEINKDHLIKEYLQQLK